ncbi:hypothetical protein [Tianweitania sediminis]|uniref:Uncharacterized protein n=1 Tax=Tianweitania sediminis TaxID=1502156 RepID=A0A8J7R4N3_9HYPH|nr:hypothetical protein [Tianweitania sediminis]MBP0440716.1 hypothetical protein [Tianweitania sediminis]
MERKTKPRWSPPLVWLLLFGLIVLVFFFGWQYSSPDQELLIVPSGAGGS